MNHPISKTAMRSSEGYVSMALLACVFFLGGAAPVIHAQNVPVGRVLTVDGVSAALMPVDPPQIPGLPSVPEQFLVSGIMVSLCTTDASVQSFHTSMRVETASGARLDFAGILKRDPNRAWVSQIFFSGKDPVVRVLSLTVIPLQPNQIKSFDDR
jgi:hypothetical protein